MKHWVLLVALLIGAVISYAMGFEAGVIILIALGVVFELAFWFLALRGPRRKSSAQL